MTCEDRSCEGMFFNLRRLSAKRASRARLFCSAEWRLTSACGSADSTTDFSGELDTPANPSKNVHTAGEVRRDRRRQKTAKEVTISSRSASFQVAPSFV